MSATHESWASIAMSGFFEEVRRRKVYRVATAYIVAAGAIIQIASAVFPAWDLPGWSLRLAIAFLLIGFPIALILAWAYDITPQGIEVTPRVPGTHRRLNFVLLIVAGLAASAIAGWFLLLPRASAGKIDKSIAVLPFQNLSDEKENAYFADGMQDDILTNLSKIGDLKVISRTSVMSYREGTRNAHDIGKALGVATLLEGSVRRSGNRVRVNVQLINAENDAHIWAEDYDRDLNDVFAIQSDLAQKIVAALQARLSPNEKAQLDRRPTENSKAYLLYLEAEQYAAEPDVFSETSRKAEELYEQAIALDRKFAEAFAGLSMIESWAYHTVDPTPRRLEKARSTAEEALRLQPNLSEGHLALGYYYYYGTHDYERALAEFETARGGRPNESQAYLAIAAIQRREGKWTESLANFEKAAALDPRNPKVLHNLGFTYLAMRNYAAADNIYDRMIAATPQSFNARALKGVVAIFARGDIALAQENLDALPPSVDADGLVTSTRVWVLSLGQNYPEALRVLEEFRGEVLNAYNGPTPKAFLEALLYHCLGDQSKAVTAMKYARVVTERLVSENPANASRHALLGQVLALLGEKDAAIAEGKRAAQLLPESQDAYDGPQIIAALAGIYTWVGESDEAFRLLDHLLQVPNGVTVPLLKLDPGWEPLRHDARFQALIDKYSTKG